jgi:hypothetical protein
MPNKYHTNYGLFRRFLRIAKVILSLALLVIKLGVPFFPALCYL